jgi:N-acetylmuramoyl-L-alanine amidase
LNHNGVVDPWERIKECPCFDAMTEYMDINKIL